MKSKTKVVKPIKESTITELVDRSTEISNRMLKMDLNDHAAIKESLQLSKELHAITSAYCDKIKEEEELKKTRREEESEAKRVRRIINPNFPDQEWRAYSYQELDEICKEWGNELPHAFRSAFIRIGIEDRKADVDFYHGGDISKAKFYPTELNWLSFTLFVDGKPLTDRQRELNNLQKLTQPGLQNYSDYNPQMIIPEMPLRWRERLLQFHSDNLQ